MRTSAPDGANLTVVGRSVPRLDGLSKVTGRARYGIDIAIPGMVVGTLLRSPHPHARIVSIDPAPAREMPGVLAVLTWREVSALEIPGTVFRDQPLLARGRVRYEGEPVAAVAAADDASAEAALEHIVVDYEPLPVAGDLASSLAPGAPLIHEELTGTSGAPPRDLAPLPGTNILHTATYRQGDPDAGFAGSDLVVEERYCYPSVHHYAMEPHVAVAQVQEGTCTFWSGTRRPFIVRREIARRFGLPEAAVRVVVPYLGGAYGSKSYVKIEPLALALARACGRPVRIVLPAAAGFVTVTGYEVRVDIASAVKRDGTLVARRTRVYVDLGAYADGGPVGPRIAANAAFRSCGPYRIPHMDLQGFAVYTNRVPGGALRGYGAPQVAWAYESHTDTLACALKLDPLRFRQQNLLTRGEAVLPGAHPMDGDAWDVLRTAARRTRTASLTCKNNFTPKIGLAPSSRVGWGAAVTAKESASARTISGAIVRLHRDGSANVAAGSVETGQGAHTVLAQIAAEELRLPIDRLRVDLPDTAVTPFDQGTGGSGSTIVVGHAVRAAALEIREQLCALAAQVLSTTPEAIRLSRGYAHAGRKKVAYAALLRQSSLPDPELIGRGVFQQAVDGRRAIYWEIGAVGVQVHVDPETGLVTPVHLIGAADVGRAIHPQLAAAQHEGAVIMGLGPAMFESVVYQAGQMLNRHALEYRVPLAEDLPERCETRLIEGGDGPGPYGSKGAGEAGVLSIAPAIANAVFAASGVRITELPLLPERVYWALRQKESERHATVAVRRP